MRGCDPQSVLIRLACAGGAVEVAGEGDLGQVIAEGFLPGDG